MSRIKIILADDHVIVRQGVRSLIEQEVDMVVIGEANDGIQLLKSVEKLHPDVVLADIKMPNMNGIDAAEEIHRRFPQVHTVVLTMHADPAYIERAMQAGVHGYVLKDEDVWEMFSAIRHAAQGRRYFSPRVLDQFPDQLSARVNHPNTMQLLTIRERQVFQLVVEGRTSAEIAKILDISVRTVEGHRANMMSKLNLKSQIDLIRYAMKHNIYLEQEKLE